MKLNYFAYGSNMSLARLRQRVPSADPLGTYCLTAHRLLFHKAGWDDSAKCDAFATGDHGDVVMGVVYRMESQHKSRLDAAEGLGAGYEEKTVVVTNTLGSRQQAFLYYATHIDEQLMPYSWYLDHVLTGAREARLPAQYVQQIDAVTAREDTDRERDTRERVIHRQRRGN